MERNCGPMSKNWSGHALTSVLTLAWSDQLGLPRLS